MSNCRTFADQPGWHLKFGWSAKTAERLMAVYEQSKVNNLCNLEIDLSTLYLIAAPKTPEPVRE